MCDPITGLMVASTLLSAGGQIQQGNAANAAAKYNAQVAEMNANIAEKRGFDAIERGQKEEQRKRAETSRLMGAQQAAMAANGVDLTFGSPLDVITGTAALGEIDALTIRSNAAREEYDYKVQAVNSRAGGALERMKGKSAQTAGYLGAAGTVLGGGASAWKQAKVG